MQLLKSFGNSGFFPEFRHKEMLSNKYATKVLICISEIIGRKSELKMESVFTYRHTSLGLPDYLNLQMFQNGDKTGC